MPEAEERVFRTISAMGHLPAFHRTYFFVFLMQFGLLRAAACVSSPIHSLVQVTFTLSDGFEDSMFEAKAKASIFEAKANASDYGC